eukprot:TRINITY_DN4350_c0_g1_i5.p1 TRINITY_DN4350_c0_g1~~TRINITY_DN4350_c0_g1_i5.p1  ORF type:complete len:277 (+),score=-29.82 TRINITY_DN4350_c0_g1_i5:565-1395(+)
MTQSLYPCRPNTEKSTPPTNYTPYYRNTRIHIYFNIRYLYYHLIQYRAIKGLTFTQKLFFGIQRTVTILLYFQKNQYTSRKKNHHDNNHNFIIIIWNALNNSNHPYSPTFVILNLTDIGLNKLLSVILACSWNSTTYVCLQNISNFRKRLLIFHILHLNLLYIIQSNCSKQLIDLLVVILRKQLSYQSMLHCQLLQFGQPLRKNDTMHFFHFLFVTFGISTTAILLSITLYLFFARRYKNITFIQQFTKPFNLQSHLIQVLFFATNFLFLSVCHIF